MGLREEARQYLPVAFEFEPNNEEIKKELPRVEELHNMSRKKEPIREDNPDSLSSNSSQVEDDITFDPLRLSIVPRHPPSSRSSMKLDLANPTERVRKANSQSNGDNLALKNP